MQRASFNWQGLFVGGERFYLGVVVCGCETPGGGEGLMRKVMIGLDGRSALRIRVAANLVGRWVEWWLWR